MKVRKKSIVVDAIQWDGKDLFPGSEVCRLLESGNDETTWYVDTSRIIIGNHADHEIYCLPGDYIIRDKNGDFSLCKPLAFEQEYEPIEKASDPIESPSHKNISFSRALDHLKNGKNLCREGWYGKHHISIVADAVYPIEGIEGGEEIDMFIAIHPQNGGCIPWLASQADMLADDWMVME